MSILFSAKGNEKEKLIYNGRNYSYLSDYFYSIDYYYPRDK
jgi:hypothetical protein